MEGRVGDRFLVCSDGVTAVLDDDEIHEVLADVAEPADAVDRLIALANEGGGPDNITCVVADLVDGTRRTRADSSSARRPRRRPRPDPAADRGSCRPRASLDPWRRRRPHPAPRPRRGPAGVLGLVGAGAALAALVAAVLTLVVSGPVDVVPGLSNPDRLTTLGLPAVRALAEIAMAVAVGALLLAAFLVPPQRSGLSGRRRLPRRPRRRVRRARAGRWRRP